MKKLRIFAIVLLVIACDSNKIDYPTVYVFDRFETGTINVYSEGIKLENQTAAERFTSARSDVFYQSNSFRLEGFGNETITFLSSSRSIIEWPDSVITADITRIDNKVYFETTDTLYLSDDLSRRVQKFIFAPLTEVSRTSIPFSTGFRTIYGYRSCIYAIQDGLEIRIPMIALLEKSCLPGSSQQVLGGCSIIQAVSDFNNMLDLNYLNTFSTDYSDDTLAVQQNFIVYKRK